jgi:hypothetical protein
MPVVLQFLVELYHLTAICKAPSHESSPFEIKRPARRRGQGNPDCYRMIILAKAPCMHNKNQKIDQS